MARKRVRVRDAAGTRERLLKAAATEMHAAGFQAVSVDRVITGAGVTKGALYHHFASKDALAHAVITELLGGSIEQFGQSLQEAPDPIVALRAWLEGPPWIDLKLGCPLNNLAQEMSAVDEKFRKRIEAVFTAWRAAIAAALKRGQAKGLVRRKVDCDVVAAFVLATLEGSISMAKSARDDSLFFANMKLLSGYLEGLREPS